MKKDLIFAPILLAVGIALGLLKATGMTVHMVLSGVGLVALIAYTLLCKKEFGFLPLEIGMRVSYGVALITGIVLKIRYIAVLGILHKIFAIVFLVALIAVFVQKWIAKKKNG